MVDFVRPKMAELLKLGDTVKVDGVRSLQKVLSAAWLVNGEWVIRLSDGVHKLDDVRANLGGLK